MDPLNNQVFSYNFRKFVLQEQDVRPINQSGYPPTKPFSVDPPNKTEKSKNEPKQKGASKKQKEKENPFDL